MTTTTIASESFTSDLTPAESIVAALRVLGVDLVLDPETETEIKAVGRTTQIDAYLLQKMKEHKPELVALVQGGSEVVDTASASLETATTWLEIETALAMVIDAFDGHLIGYESIEAFSRQANIKARTVPPAGAVVEQSIGASNQQRETWRI